VASIYLSRGASRELISAAAELISPQGELISRRQPGTYPGPAGAFGQKYAHRNAKIGGRKE